MFFDDEIIVGRVGPGPAEHVVHGAPGITIVTGTLAIFGIPESLFILQHVIYTELALDKQILDGLNLGKTAGNDTVGVNLVEGFFLSHGIRITKGRNINTTYTYIFTTIYHIVRTILIVREGDRRQNRSLTRETGSGEYTTTTRRVNNAGKAL